MKMRALKNLLFILGLVLAISCNHQDDSLPILGRKQVQRTGDKVDTVYHTIRDFEFVDQDSAIVNNETFNNSIYVADFFFTSCPTICPVMKTQMLRVYDAFEDEPGLKFLSHTIDPEYDTVALLHEFAKNLGVESDRWHFVTGEKPDIYEAAKKSYMVTAQEDQYEPGGYVHSGALILVDRDRRIRGIYDGTKEEDVDRLIADIPVLLREYQK